MKNLVAVFVLAFVLNTAATDPQISVKFDSIPGDLKVGAFPTFGFTVSGINTDSVIQAVVVLKKDGEEVGIILTDFISGETNDDTTSFAFTWGLTRYKDYVSEMMCWPKPGRYSILIGLIDPRQIELTKLTGTGIVGVQTDERFLASVETEEFEIAGLVPQLIIHRYPWTPPGKVVLYASGEPGERYILQTDSILPPPEYADDWYGMISFEIPAEGMQELIATPSGSQGFFKLLKNP